MKYDTTIGPNQVALRMYPPKWVADFLAAEAEARSSSMASLLRRLVKQHQGIQSLGPPKHEYNVNFDRLTKAERDRSPVTVRLSPEQDAHVVHIAECMGLSKSHVLLLMFLEYIGLPALPPATPVDDVGPTPITAGRSKRKR